MTEQTCARCERSSGHRVEAVEVINGEWVCRDCWVALTQGAAPLATGATGPQIIEALERRFAEEHWIQGENAKAYVGVGYIKDLQKHAAWLVPPGMLIAPATAVVGDCDLSAWIAKHGLVKLNAIIRIAHPALVRHIGGDDEELRDLYDALIQLGAALRPFEDEAQPLVYRAIIAPAAAVVGEAEREAWARVAYFVRLSKSFETCRPEDENQYSQMADWAIQEITDADLATLTAMIGRTGEGVDG